MKIVSWNVQDMKYSQVLQEILYLKRAHNSNIMFILETLVNSTNINSILPKTRFEHFDYVDSINHSGGITVLWNNNGIHASILSKEQRAIHLLVHDVKKNQNVIISRIYAPA